VAIKMTNREMIMLLKDATPAFKHIREVAEKIISKTYTYSIDGVNYIAVTETGVFVGYDYSCGGEWDRTEIEIPIEWFDEEFDYVKAYEEILRKEEANRKRAEKARLKRVAKKKKRAKVLKEKKEYKTYLKLKDKYESKGKSNVQH
jgi:hypothetical protein